MKVIVCELCEGRSFVKQDGMYVCKSCGAQFSPEDAKNMMQEVADEAPVAVPSASADNGSAELDKYLLLARRAKDSGNSADAAKYYGLAQAEDPNSWECAFYSVYHTAMQTNIAGITSAANLVSGCIESVVDLIRDHTPSSEQLDACTQLVNSCNSIATMFLTAAVNHYNGIGDSIRSNYTAELRQRATAAWSVAYSAAAYVERSFGSIPAYYGIIGGGFTHAAIMKESNSTAYPSSTEIEDLVKIAKYDKAFVTPRVQKRIANLNASIEKTSKSTTSNGCIGFFLLLTSAVIAIICGLSIPSYASEVAILFYSVAAVFGIPGIICVIPKPKSQARKAKDDALVEVMKKNKAILEDLIRK